LLGFGRELDVVALVMYHLLITKENETTKRKVIC